MASFQSHKSGVRAFVHVNGKRKTKILPTKTDGLVWPYKTSSLDALWRKTVRKAMIDDLHFHDLRALAATRMSKKLNPLQLAKVLGHKDLRSVMIYYREDVTDFADDL